MGLEDAKPAPVIDYLTESWLGFYSRLHNSRPASFSGVMPIPATEILAQMQLTPIPASGDEAQVMVMALDRVFIDHHSEKPKAEKKEEE